MLKNRGSAPQEAGMRSQDMSPFPANPQSSHLDNRKTVVNRSKLVFRILLNYLKSAPAFTLWVNLHTQFVASIVPANQDILNFIRRFC